MASRRRIKKPLKDYEIEEFLDEEESSFDESVGSDDIYVPPQDIGHRRRRISSEASSANSENEYEEEWLEEEDPLELGRDIDLQELEDPEEEEVAESADIGVIDAENREEQLRAAVENTDDERLEDQIDRVNRNSIWGPVGENFRPRKAVSETRACRTPEIFTESSKPIDIFLKMFPKSLLDYIAQCTNLRIEKVRSEVGDRDARARKRSYMTFTDRGEIMIVLGSTLIMGYNQLPSFSDYWSLKPSLGNPVIKAAIGRDRCKFLLSKLYFTDPEKPPNASKTYYLEEVLNCLKTTFKKYREDSHVQSIDESMTKFKGRSSLKQYMPMKPVKRGIKMWVRADSRTGYAYDMNIYVGRESNPRQNQEFTLGENVIRTLTSTITNPDTTICFDRFFTSVTLMDTLEFPCVGTCNAARRNMPKICPGKKFKQGEMAFVENGRGTIAVRWQDTKDVILMSNFHGPEITEVRRKLKTGAVVPVPAPEIVAFYRHAMGGVDRNDRMVGEHEFERKSTKWWKKVFYRLLKMAIVNSWVIYREKVNRKCSMKNFLIDLSLEMMEYGKQNTHKKQRSNKESCPRGLQAHLPVQVDKRKRCVSCTQKKKDTRTYTMCMACQRYLCKNCFAAWHIS